MDIKHLEKLEENAIKAKSNKFIIGTLNEIDIKRKIQAVEFIRNLNNMGIPLERINTNDWESCPEIKVYVYCNAYKRFSNYDLNNAFKLAVRLMEVTNE